MRVIILFILFNNPIFGQELSKAKLDSLKQTGINNVEVEQYYNKNKGNSKPSKSVGSVSNGKLINGKLIPFKGKNYTYFDVLSYINGRGYLNSTVLNIVLETYKKFETILPCRRFVIMECSNKDGGKMFPHKTHQNGLSVDFMMPLTKNDEAYYDLDTLGGDHYFLDFDDDGNYIEDKTIKINFNLVAQHILLLDYVAKLFNSKIEKVIINTDLKDNLFATEFGEKLKNKDIYFVKKLSPLINSLHDDHFHIDFKI